MNYMNYYNMCDTKANQGLEELEKYLNGTKDLLYTKGIGDKIITIDVEYGTDDDCTCTEFLGTWEFDINGKFIE